MKLTATTFDGDEKACTAIHYMCAADRIAFEKHFRSSPVVMSQWRDFLKDEPTDAEVTDEAAKRTESPFKPGVDLSGIREEWQIFFGWRELRRHHPQLPDFDSFTDQLAEFQVIMPKSKPDPTEEDQVAMDPSAPAALTA